MTNEQPEARVSVEAIEKLKSADLIDLVDNALDTIAKGGGFGGWLNPPPREVMERYWRGVVMIPERTLFVGRVDGAIAAAQQLARPSKNNELGAHAATLTGAFVADWARQRGLARLLTATAEAKAREEGFRVLNLDVRETHTVAIAMYERMGFRLWGINPHYAIVNGTCIAGRYYTKDLTKNSISGEATR